MAKTKREELANGAPESPQIPTMLATLPTSDTIPGFETLDSPNHGSPARYEQLREQRIKENLERLQKLGIVDLSIKLKTAVAAKRAPRNFSSERKTPIRALASEPRRRSSRLQSVTPVSYVENVKLTKQEGKRRKDSILLEEGAKPEIYTEEHEKLLGSTELEWTFFVDGYGADGKRIYDQIKGKTCHQCRQKTLGYRTHCSKCQIVQGQFCGDCLYMRYGEHVLEANKNPDWICPPCRGICNCSLCRQAKGWAPTGPMYKRIASLGYKSVAHFLIHTKQAPPATESEEIVSKSPNSAKRSLEHFLIHTKQAPPATESEEIVSKIPNSAKRSLAFTVVDVSFDPHKKVIDGQKLDFVKNENDISMLNVGEKGTSESKDVKGEQVEDKKSDIGDKKTDESKDEKGEQEDCKENYFSMLNVGESEVKDGPEMMKAENDDHAMKTVSSCEPKSDSIARRTRSRCEEGSRDSLQDSNARRLRPRITGA